MEHKKKHANDKTKKEEDKNGMRNFEENFIAQLLK